MRNKKIGVTILLALIIATISLSAFAQNDSRRDIITSAMRDELARNMKNLTLENMERPFFLSYNIYDVETTEIVASLGSIVRSSSSHNRNHNARVMVGGYEINDENFRSMGTSSRSSMIHNTGRLPLEDDYNGIRRALWVATDNTYKSAAELFELKIAALEQQTISEDAKLDDFSRAPAEFHIEDPKRLAIDREAWEKKACDISDVFRSYPDIYSSYVRVLFYSGEMYMLNSEGAEVITPLTIALVQINAYTQAVDGEALSDHFSICNALQEELPKKRALIREAKAMAVRLIELRSAPVFDDSYFGPVMFEGQAAVEFVAQRLFSGKQGLIASRKTLSGGSQSFGYREEDTTLDDRMDRRILSRDLSITAKNSLVSYKGLNLIGHFRIDAEGVKTPDELSLVENGILKTLLTNRTPTRKVKLSNGHQRLAIGNGYWTSSAIGPGVISMTSSEGKSDKELKDELISRAKDEGLDYAIIIRKLKPLITGAQYYDPIVRMASTYSARDGLTLTEPLLAYRINVNDGSEERIRSLQLQPVSLSALRHIAGVSKKSIATNKLTITNWSSGIPASFIVPEKILLEELEVKKVKRDFTPKLPSVPNPLSVK